MKSIIQTLGIFLLLTTSAQANSYVEKLKAKGFRCLTANGNGFACLIPPQKGIYSQPVAILVPANLSGDPTRAVLYIHGFLRVCSGEQGTSSEVASKLADKFKFMDLLGSASATSSVLVMPMSSMTTCYDKNRNPRKCYGAYNSELVPRFGKFISWVKTFVPAHEWIATGHSGAGSVLASILSTNKEFTKTVRGTVLLDATYGDRNWQWKQVFQINPAMKLVSSYIPGTPTAASSINLKNIPAELAKGTRGQKPVRVNPNNIIVTTAPGGSHCKLPGPSYFPGLLSKAK